MFELFGKENKEPWRDGVYLTTTNDSFQADILVSKLQGAGIPSEKRYVGAGNFIEISMGHSNACAIEIYVPESALEEAREVIVPVPIDDDFEEASEDEDER